jgi:hypothetical protein
MVMLTVKCWLRVMEVSTSAGNAYEMELWKSLEFREKNNFGTEDRQAQRTELTS